MKTKNLLYDKPLKLGLVERAYFKTGISQINSGKDGLVQDQAVAPADLYEIERSAPDTLRFNDAGHRTSFFRDILSPFSFGRAYSARADVRYEQALKNRDPDFYKLYNNIRTDLIAGYDHLKNGNFSVEESYDFTWLFFVEQRLCRWTDPRWTNLRMQSEYSYQDYLPDSTTSTAPGSVYDFDLKYFADQTSPPPVQSGYPLLFYDSDQSHLRYIFPLFQMMSVHPLNAVMGPKEKRWYAYWRQQFLAGNPLPVYSSYLLLFLYELFENAAGNPEEALSRVESVFEAYSGQLYQISVHAGIWTIEVCEENNLPKDPFFRLFHKYFSRVDQEHMLNLYLTLKMDDDQLKIPAHMMPDLSGYRFSANKIYQDDPDTMLEAFSLALDLYQKWTRSKGRSYLQALNSEFSQTDFGMEYDPVHGVRSAYYHSTSPYYRDNNSWFYRLPVKKFQEDDEFLKINGDIFRETIRLMKQILQSPKGAPKRTELSKDFIAQLEQALNERFNPQFQQAPQKVELDFQAIRRLRKESDQVRAVLEVDEESGSTLETIAASDQKPDVKNPDLNNMRPEAAAISEPGSFQLSSAEKEALNTIWNSLRRPMQNLIIKIDQQAQSGGLNATAKRMETVQAINEAFRPVLQAEIIQEPDVRNRLFMNSMLWPAMAAHLKIGSYADHSGSSLNQPALKADLPDAQTAHKPGPVHQPDAAADLADIRAGSQSVSDKPAVLAADARSAQTQTAGSLNPETSEASGSIADFVSTLSDLHKQALKIIQSGQEVSSRLESLAASAFSMPDLLLDEINGPFVDQFDDVLVETWNCEPCITQQYQAELEEALKPNE